PQNGAKGNNVGPYCTSFFCKIEGDMLRIASCDGYRMAETRIKIDIENKGDLVDFKLPYCKIPASAKKGYVIITVSENFVEFEILSDSGNSQTIKLDCEQSEDKLPDVSIKDENIKISITINPLFLQRLGEALKGQNSVKIDIANELGPVKVTADNFSGFICLMRGKQ
ncbi:MAG: hypothetical protein WCY05_08130, partial [Candidatus Omnitrophota bacterium]